MITQPLDDHQHPTPPPNPDDHIAIREPRKTQMKSKPKLTKSNPDEITTTQPPPPYEPSTTQLSLIYHHNPFQHLIIQTQNQQNQTKK